MSGAGMRVTRNIGKRLLHDPVHRALDFRRLTIAYPIVDKHDGRVVMPAKFGQMRLQRGNQAEVVERGRVEQMGQIADAAQCGVSVRLCIRQQRVVYSEAIELSLSGSELELHRSEGLPNGIVKLARDPTLLVLLNVNQLR